MYNKIYGYRKQDKNIWWWGSIMSENYSWHGTGQKAILYLQNLTVLLFKNKKTIKIVYITHAYKVNSCI